MWTHDYTQSIYICLTFSLTPLSDKKFISFLRLINFVWYFLAWFIYNDNWRYAAHQIIIFNKSINIEQFKRHCHFFRTKDNSIWNKIATPQWNTCLNLVKFKATELLWKKNEFHSSRTFGVENAHSILKNDFAS